MNLAANLQQPALMEGWHSIADYGLIGNCRTAALVSKTGSIDWCCFPRFDSPSYFGRLMDLERGGYFRISPAAPFVSTQRYQEHTNVLITEFRSGSARARLLDLFAVRDVGSQATELWPDHEILRIIEVFEGELEFEAVFHPRAYYGREPLHLEWEGQWGLRCCRRENLVLLQSDVTGLRDATALYGDGGAAVARFTLAAGDRRCFSLSYSQTAPGVIPALGPKAFERYRLSVEYWRSWEGACRYHGPYAELVRRSALSLKLLNFAPAGSFVAAPTASLPEFIGGTRNWDYRFCWLRDASFTVRALVELGYLAEAKSFLNWLLHSTRLTWPRLQVLYSLCGESRIGESELGWLSGYRDSRPVRVGNGAAVQNQLDVYGEVIDSLFALSPFLEFIDNDTRKMAIGCGQAVVDAWEQPDQGIWEIRGAPRHHTHSKVMAWVAMDRLSKLAARHGWKLPWDAGAVAARIRARIEARGYDAAQRSYVANFGGKALDASLLTLPLVGYCAASSPRFASTREAIIRTLTRNGLVYRYALRSDGFDEPEGAFQLCNFWMAETFAAEGRFGLARQWFEALARSFNPCGLAAEEIDPEKREYLGNYPQGFSHIGLIHAALGIAKEAA